MTFSMVRRLSSVIVASTVVHAKASFPAVSLCPGLMGVVLFFCMVAFLQQGNAFADGQKSSSSTQEQIQKRCQIANAFKQARMFDRALAEYEAVLQDKSFLADGKIDCAHQGLIAVAKERLNDQIKSLCATADGLKQARLYDQAIARYEAVLKDEKLLKEGATDCARKGLLDTAKAQLKNNCELAGMYLEAGRLPDAEALYKKVIETASGQDLACAKDGMSKIAQAYFARGKALEGPRIGAAVEAYDAAIKAGDNSAGAHQTLTNAQRKKNVEYLQALIDFGLETDAQTQLKDYLKADPTFRHEAQRFEFIAGPRVPFLRELRETSLEDALQFQDYRLVMPRWIAKIPLIEALGLCILAWLIGRKLLLWGKPTLKIGAFSGDKDKGGEDKNKTAAAFAAELQHQLIDFSSASRANQQVLMVTGPIERNQIDITADLPLPANWKALVKSLQSLLSSLISRPSLAINGFLQEDASGCKGVTIQLESGSRVVAKHALWAEDFGIRVANDDKVDNKNDGKGDGKNANERHNEDLAACAAVWVLFNLQMFPAWKASIRARRGKYGILGTSEWEAYAWFVLGDLWNARGKPEMAEAAYLNALTVDPKFSASRINLAGIWHHFYEYGKPETKQRLEDALSQLDAVPFEEMMRRSHKDPGVYAGLFRRAAIHFDLASVSDKEQHIHEALTLTNELVEKMVAARADQVFGQGPDADLKRYLDRRLPIAQCMKLGLKAASLKGPAELTDYYRHELSRVERPLRKSTEVYSLYNLACTYALFAALDPKYQSDSLNCLDRMFSIAKSLESLGRAFTGVCIKMAKRAKSDAAFQHLWQNAEFKRIVSQHLDAHRTGGSAEVTTQDDGLSAAEDVGSKATGGNTCVTTVHDRNPAIHAASRTDPPARGRGSAPAPVTDADHVSVGRGLGDLAGTDAPAGAERVVYDDRLPEREYAADD